MPNRALRIPAVLSLPSATRPYLSSVNLNLTPDDVMYENDDAHYLSCGATALNVMLASLQLANVPPPASILDFGAGAGRVTRWLCAAFPTGRLSACDLREQDMSFCHREFLADTWISGTNIDALVAPGTYDLIWVGSVLTHLSADHSTTLIHKLLSWTNADGLLVMSTHGRFAKTHQDSGNFRYLHDEGWKTAAGEYVETGFGYADYLNQTNYGISLTKLSWLAELVEKMPNVRLVVLSERVWDEHHDVLAIQNRAISS